MQIVGIETSHQISRRLPAMTCVGYQTWLAEPRLSVTGRPQPSKKDGNNVNRQPSVQRGKLGIGWAVDERSACRPGCRYWRSVASDRPPATRRGRRIPASARDPAASPPANGARHGTAAGGSCGPRWSIRSARSCPVAAGGAATLGRLPALLPIGKVTTAPGNEIPSFPRVGFHIRRGCVRDGEHLVTQRQHTLDPLAEAFHEHVVAPFGTSHRDQIVEQQCELQTVGLASPVDQTRDNPDATTWRRASAGCRRARQGPRSGGWIPVGQANWRPCAHENAARA